MQTIKNSIQHNLTPLSPLIEFLTLQTRVDTGSGQQPDDVFCTWDAEVPHGALALSSCSGSSELKLSRNECSIRFSFVAANSAVC